MNISARREEAKNIRTLQARMLGLHTVNTIAGDDHGKGTLAGFLEAVRARMDPTAKGQLS
jgi:hypothetical protein